MNEPIAYLNGRDVPVSEARLHVFDLGVVAGASVTEQMRTFRHETFRLEAHLDRLFDSLRAVGRSAPLTKGELSVIIDRVVRHNAALMPPTHDLGVVVFITLGQNLTYLGAAGRRAASRMSVCAHTFPLPFELWAQKLERGQHLVTPAVRQIPPDSLDPRIKSRNRLIWTVADQQARLADGDAVALLLDRNGHLTETGTANLFLVRDGVLFTPPPGAALEGISQNVVRELAADLGIAYVPQQLELFDLLNSDEAFVSSTPSCLLPVTRVNGVILGNGIPGPVFQRLAQAWSRLVGIDWIAQAKQVAAERLASNAGLPSGNGTDFGW